MNHKLSMTMIELFNAYAEGTASDEQVAELERLIREDPALRRQFAACTMIRAGLIERARAEASVDRPAPTPAPLGLWIGAVSLAAAVLLIASVAAIYLIAGGNGKTSPPSPTERERVTATLVDSTGTVVIGGEVAERGSDYPARLISIDRGTADFRVPSGASVRLSGKTRAIVDDPMNVTLERGVVRVTCPPAAVGFAVTLPDGTRVVDLGTEFEVHASAEGVAQVAVHKGRVRVETADGRDPTVLGAGAVAVLREVNGRVAVTLATPGEDVRGSVADSRVLFADDFESGSLDLTTWNMTVVTPPATMLEIVPDRADRFGRGVDNRIARLVDRDADADRPDGGHCFLGFNGRLDGGVFTLGFDFYESAAARRSQQLGPASIRLVTDGAPYSRAKVYALRLSNGDLTTDASATSLARYTTDRAVRVRVVVNHTEDAMRYTSHRGERALPAKSADVWIDGQWMARIDPASAEAYGRSITGVSFLSVPGQTQDFYIDNITVRRGALVEPSDASLETGTQPGDSR